MSRVGSWTATAILALTVAVLPGAAVVPAAAAACTDAGGITVVVDPGNLTGSLSQTCVASGGDDAAALFAAAGHALERVQRFPGAVCKVDNQPASAGCVNMPPADAYWGLFWSNGTSGSWAYASQGVDSLSVPAGGSVAFAWQASSSRRNPAAAPPDHDGSEPSDDGSGGSGGATGGGTGGSTGGSGGSAGGSGGGSGDGTPSTSPSDSPTAAESAPPRERARERDRDRDRDPEAASSEGQADAESESGEPTEDATVLPGAEGQDAAAPASDAVTEGGLPLWLVGLAALGLLGVGTVVAVARRRAAVAGGA